MVAVRVLVGPGGVEPQFVQYVALPVLVATMPVARKHAIRAEKAPVERRGQALYLPTGVEPAGAGASEQEIVEHRTCGRRVEWQGFRRTAQS